MRLEGHDSHETFQCLSGEHGSQLSRMSCLYLQHRLEEMPDLKETPGKTVAGKWNIREANFSLDGGGYLQGIPSHSGLEQNSLLCIKSHHFKWSWLQVEAYQNWEIDRSELKQNHILLKEPCIRKWPRQEKQGMPENWREVENRAAEANTTI